MAGGVMDIPVARKCKLLMLGQHGVRSEPLHIHGTSHLDSEEFDFSDVFGSMPSPHLNPPLATVEEREDSSCWPPPEIVCTKDSMVIYSRSHSLVGPSPRPSLIRQRSKLVWEDADHLPAEDSGKVAKKSSLSHERGMASSPESGSFFGLPALALSDSGDSGSDIGGEEQEQNGVLTGKADEKLGPQDFELLRVVGQGAFGKVFQVQKKGTSEIYAMKVMRKDTIMDKNHGDYMKAERDILTKIVHPFIVQLQYSFQTKTKLYLLLDFINGGHLFFQLYRQGIFSEDLARIYTAEIVSAVAHLHSNGIIHRDLKPENILLDAEGHVKLTDFGLAKEVDDSKKSNSLCGTIEYMAPEIMLAKGHGKAADWWSVGILLYEMLTGQPPFSHDNRQKLQQKILKDKIKIPTYLTGPAITFLKGLLQKDPSKRLGSGAKDSEEIKQHKWFKSINWRKVEARQLQPKFRPTVHGIQCTANFDEMWTKMPLQDSPASTPKGGDDNFFHGYTYVAPSPWLLPSEEAA